MSETRVQGRAEVREVTWQARDIGYGVEEGVTVGTWGESDWTRKRSFFPADGSAALYLFEGEVLADVAGDNREMCARCLKPITSSIHGLVGAPGFYCSSCARALMRFGS